ncbi:DDE-type integrase/transposase/recombinase [Bacillus sp. AF62]
MYTKRYINSCEKYVNNSRNQDHQFIKTRIRNMLGLKSLQTATTMIVGIEALHLIKKEQTFQEQKSVQKQIYFIHELLV